MTSIAAEDTAQAKGFPPKVEPWEPGSKTPNISLFATMQDIGITPPPSAFPKIKIGRASCRERVHISETAEALTKNKIEITRQETEEKRTRSDSERSCNE